MSAIIEKKTAKVTGALPTNINFLILEDMDNLRSQLITDLRTLGMTGKMFEAPDLKTAIELCKTENIEFVIADWNLPDGTGLDFLIKFRAVFRFKKTPFVICTTESEISYFINAVSQGANDFIVKPWNLEELKKKIHLTWETYVNKNAVKA